jgi:subtilisin-like proprotein convertase family protein
LTLAGSGINLYWSDPLGGSGNDYDIFRLNTAGTTVAASSTNLQTGAQDPFEQMSSSTSSPRIVIVKKTGAANRFLHLNTNRGRLSTATAGQTHGHAAAGSTSSFGVAAVNAGPSFPNPFSTSNVVETFSSDGPRKVFYLGNGTPITPGDVSATGGVNLLKPDIAAADGVAVSGAGGFPTPFFGTSAAAPNAAAIMALIKSQNPGLTPTQLRSALFATAVDIEAAGIDRDSGRGIVMAVPPQPGCTFTLTPPGGNVAILGGSTNATVNASNGSCNWVAWSTVPWISMSGGGAGTGSGPLGLIVQANHGPARSGNIMIQGGQIATVFQLGTPPATFDFTGAVPIPDVSTVEVPLSVSGVSQRITHLSVSLRLTHTFDGDLAISLVGPDGTTVALSAHRGGSGANYGSACSPATSRTTFDDSATNPISVGTAPFLGSFRPEQTLSVFNNKPANGTWKLRVTDDAALDVGTVLCWALNINQGPLFGLANDFNGNGVADLAVFRPGTGQWFINGLGSTAFGQPGDVPVPGDYDGNGDGRRRGVSALDRPVVHQRQLARRRPVRTDRRRPGAGGLRWRREDRHRRVSHDRRRRCVAC